MKEMEEQSRRARALPETRLLQPDTGRPAAAGAARRAVPPMKAFLKSGAMALGVAALSSTLFITTVSAASAATLAAQSKAFAASVAAFGAVRSQSGPAGALDWPSYAGSFDGATAGSSPHICLRTHLSKC